MAELTFNERVDDAILCAAFRLSRLREGTSLRSAIRDFRQSCIENLEDDDDQIWSLRVARCDAMQFRQDDELRKMAFVALERER